MKIEVGKAYRTRGGWRAVVAVDDGIERHYRVNHYLDDSVDVFWHLIDGTVNLKNKQNFDLISEWTDEPTAALDAKIKRYEDALHYLIERADDSNDARYGTLSASFVRDVCSKALEGTE